MTSFPSLITAPLPPANGSSIGESLHHPAFQGMPRKAGHHENWGIFNRRFWGVYVRHSQEGLIKLWSQDGGGEPVILKHGSTVGSVAVLTDGRLASAGKDGLIKLWPQDGRGSPS